MNNILSISLTIMAGATIQAAARDSIEIVKKLNRNVEFSFNGVKITVSTISTVEMITYQYFNKMEKASEES